MTHCAFDGAPISANADTLEYLDMDEAMDAIEPKELRRCPCGSYSASTSFCLEGRFHKLKARPLLCVGGVCKREAGVLGLESSPSLPTNVTTFPVCSLSCSCASLTLLAASALAAAAPFKFLFGAGAPIGEATCSACSGSNVGCSSTSIGDVNVSASVTSVTSSACTILTRTSSLPASLPSPSRMFSSPSKGSAVNTSGLRTALPRSR